ncbi:hypothetical protein ACFW6S_21460 [Streptomyces sp. NPDC058740]|uniref:hypothetical protein n=1 Tax=Streptomyces sp. NPDC058740 TaxID=3346619 RepID=UPI0036CD9571
MVRDRLGIAFEGRRGTGMQVVQGNARADWPLGYRPGPDPERLDVRRDSARRCGFGLGIHYCVGAALARAEAEAGLAVPLERLPPLRPGCGRS